MGIFELSKQKTNIIIKELVSISLLTLVPWKMIYTEQHRPKIRRNLEI